MESVKDKKNLLMLAGFWTSFIGVLLFVALGANSIFSTVVMGFACAIFMLAALADAQKQLVAFRARPLYQPVAWFFHIFVGFVAVFMSRTAISVALELPPQDFDLTQAFGAAIFYIPVWLVVAAMIFAFYGLIRFVGAMLIKFSMNTGVNAICEAPRYILSAHLRERYVAWLNSRNKIADWSMGVWVGSMLLSVGGVLAGATLMQLVMVQPKIFQHVAYFVDFQAAAKYPCLPPNARIRLHENGVVSVAEQTGWNVAITTHSYEDWQKTCQR